MHATRIMTVAALAALVVLAAPAPAQEHPRASEHPKASQMKAAAEAKAGDLVAVAAQAGDFKTLIAAVKAAGLAETLQGDGPFTVFAPTDAAFAKLPEGTVDELLKPENKTKLARILSYHVVPGKLMAKDVATTEVQTAEGQMLPIVAKDGKVTVGGASVVKTDVEAANGVIHVIDTVLMPAAPEKTKPRDHPGH